MLSSLKFTFLVDYKPTHIFYLISYHLKIVRQQRQEGMQKNTRTIKYTNKDMKMKEERKLNQFTQSECAN